MNNLLPAIGLFVLAFILPQHSSSEDLSGSMTIAEDVGASDGPVQSELERVQQALKAAQAKLQDLENRTDADPFMPPKSLGLDKDKNIDPVNSAYPITKGPGLRLAQVHFNINSTKLSPGGERLTLEAAEWIKTLPTKKVIVAGYSDTVGPSDVNKAISMSRAQEVAAVLQRAGIDPGSMKIISFGEEGTPEQTGDDVAEPLNRCVGIIVIPEEKKS